jgi:hypothetical protein
MLLYIDMNNKKYQIKTEKDKLIFTTTSFKAEKESVLHKGIYSKEFASMLFASAICVFAYMFIAFISNEIVFIHILIIIFVFIFAFLGSRKFLFNEKYIEVVFNKSNNTVSITRPGVIKKSTEKIPLDNIRSVDVGSKKFIPENIDGIKFVEKISLQHGSFIPGLGDVEEFITLLLRLTDGSERIIYAGRIEEEPDIPVEKIKDFLATDSHSPR